MELDQLDYDILRLLQNNSRLSVRKLSEELKVPKSTIYYRLRNLEKLGIIKGYYTLIDPTVFNLEYIVISFIKTKYGKQSYEKIGNNLASLTGVNAVYFVLGDIDFIVIGKYKNKEEFTKLYLEKVMSMPEVERSSTQVVIKIFKEKLI